MFAENDLKKEFEYFIEYIINGQSILEVLIEKTDIIFYKKRNEKICESSRRLDNNLYYLDQFNNYLKKILEEKNEILYLDKESTLTKNEPELSYQKKFLNNVTIFPLEKNENISVDLNYPIDDIFNL